VKPSIAVRGDALRLLPVGVARIVFDMGRGPDRMEGAIKAEARIDFTREIIRRRYDRLQRRAHESVAMGLAAGKGSGIAAEKGKMGREFLAERHIRYDSCINLAGVVIG
jgi:hypothetical protein